MVLTGVQGWSWYHRSQLLATRREILPAKGSKIVWLGEMTGRWPMEPTRQCKVGIEGGWGWFCEFAHEAEVNENVADLLTIARRRKETSWRSGRGSRLVSDGQTACEGGPCLIVNLFCDGGRLALQERILVELFEGSGRIVVRVGVVEVCHWRIMRRYRERAIEGVWEWRLVSEEAPSQNYPSLKYLSATQGMRVALINTPVQTPSTKEELAVAYQTSVVCRCLFQGPIVRHSPKRNDLLVTLITPLPPAIGFVLSTSSTGWVGAWMMHERLPELLTAVTASPLRATRGGDTMSDTVLSTTRVLTMTISKLENNESGASNLGRSFTPVCPGQSSPAPLLGLETLPPSAQRLTNELGRRVRVALFLFSSSFASRRD
jgi:hypothetical protein